MSIVLPGEFHVCLLLVFLAAGYLAAVFLISFVPILKATKN